MAAVEQFGVEESSWRAVTDACRALIGTMDEIAPAMTEAIREEEPAYRVVPLAEHRAHVHEQQTRLLAALAEHRVPDEEDLARAAALGRRRAVQGLLVETVIGAYHVGNRELWARLRSTPGPTPDTLLDVAALMWQAVQAVTASLAAAHAEVTRALHADEITLRHRLVDLLESGAVDEEAVQIAGALGFDPQGEFVALAAPAPEADGDDPAVLPDAGGSMPGPVIGVRSRTSVVVLAQGVDPAPLAARLSGRRPGTTLAVGLPRRGLAGAAQSLRDARRVLAAAGGSAGIRRFEDHWLAAVLLDHADDLRPLVGTRLGTVRANPRLAAAVRAFAGNDLSATAAAAQLALHPNTVMYRLGRWQELTGWDPRTFAGLSISVLACWLAEPFAPGDEQALAR
jgi:hypothetical protein